MDELDNIEEFLKQSSSNNNNLNNRLEDNNNGITYRHTAEELAAILSLSPPLQTTTTSNNNDSSLSASLQAHSNALASNSREYWPLDPNLQVLLNEVSTTSSTSTTSHQHNLLLPAISHINNSNLFNPVPLVQSNSQSSSHHSNTSSTHSVAHLIHSDHNHLNASLTLDLGSSRSSSSSSRSNNVNLGSTASTSTNNHNHNNLDLDNPLAIFLPRKSKPNNPPSAIFTNRISTNLNPNRPFPSNVPILTEFQRLYRNFPISTAFPVGPGSGNYLHSIPNLTEEENQIFRMRCLPPFVENESGVGLGGGRGAKGQGEGEGEGGEGGGAKAKWSKSCDPLNLFSPRFVRGEKAEREALCPICVESVARGGESEMKWMKLKNSAYVYHMSYYHGVSVSGSPFSPPLDSRSVVTENPIIALPIPTPTPTASTSTSTATPTPATTTAANKKIRKSMKEGLCHKCQNWIPLQSSKDTSTNVPEIFWWKHAKSCHSDTFIPNEGSPFIQDSVLAMIIRKKLSAGFDESTILSLPAKIKSKVKPIRKSITTTKGVGKKSKGSLGVDNNTSSGGASGIDPNWDLTNSNLALEFREGGEMEMDMEMDLGLEIEVGNGNGNGNREGKAKELSLPLPSNGRESLKRKASSSVNQKRMRESSTSSSTSSNGGNGGAGIEETHRNVRIGTRGGGRERGRGGGNTNNNLDEVNEDELAIMNELNQSRDDLLTAASILQSSPPLLQFPNTTNSQSQTNSSPLRANLSPTATATRQLVNQLESEAELLLSSSILNTLTTTNTDQLVVGGSTLTPTSSSDLEISNSIVSVQRGNMNSAFGGGAGVGGVGGVRGGNWDQDQDQDFSNYLFQNIPVGENISTDNKGGGE